MPRKNQPLRRIDKRAARAGGGVVQQSSESAAPPALPSLPPPEDLVLVGSLSRSSATPTTIISATWEPPPGVTVQSYTVQISTQNTFPAATTRTVETRSSTASAAIDGLTPGTLYYGRVAANYRDIQSAWSEVASTTTPNDTTPAGDPTNVAATWTSAGDVVVTWTPPDDENYKDAVVRLYRDAGYTQLLRIDYAAGDRYVYPRAQHADDTSNNYANPIYVRVKSRTYMNVEGINFVDTSATKAAPSSPAGVTTDFDGPDAQWDWTYDQNAARYQLTIDGIARELGAVNSYVYAFDRNRAEHAGTADPSLGWSLVAIDAIGQLSTPASGTATNPAPPQAQTPQVVDGFNSMAIRLIDTVPADFLEWEITVYRDSNLVETFTTTSAALLRSYDVSGAYTFEAAMRDMFGQLGAVSSPMVPIDHFGLGVDEIRSETYYTDSEGASEATLNQLKDDILTGENGPTYIVGSSWKWTRSHRPFVDRVQVITLSGYHSDTRVYVGVESADGSATTWYSGPLTDTDVLTQVADETAAQTAAVAIPATLRVRLPARVDSRVIILGHRNETTGYRIREMYPRRLVVADDIITETLSAITANLGIINAGEIYGVLIQGSTIQTAASGARVVMDATGLRTYDSGGTVQIEASTGTDGALTAAGGRFRVDATGVEIKAKELPSYQYTSTDSISWVDDTTGDIVATFQAYKHVGDDYSAVDIRVVPYGTLTRNIIDIVAGGVDRTHIFMQGDPLNSFNEIRMSTGSLYIDAVAILQGTTYIQGNTFVEANLYPGQQQSYYFNAGNQVHASFHGIYTNSNFSVDGAILTNDWFRSVGAVGWYNQSYGGGWYMTDTFWIRNYGNKSLRITSNQGYHLRFDGDTTLRHEWNSTNNTDNTMTVSWDGERLSFYSQEAAANVMTIWGKIGTARVGLGDRSPAYKLTVSTDSAAKPGTNTWTVISDARTKRDVAPYTDGLSALLALPPLVKFRYNGEFDTPDDDTEYVGWRAQDLEETRGAWVHRGMRPRELRGADGAIIRNADGTPVWSGEEDEVLATNTGEHVFLLHNAVIELAQQVAALRSQIERST